MPRSKTPTALAVLRGVRPDRINHDEPLPALGDPQPPPWMADDPVARAEWDRLASDLILKNVLSPWDVEAFGEYCAAVSVITEATRHLRAEGEVVTQDVFDSHNKKTGERQRRNPWSAVRKEALDVSARRAAKFGLSPSDRANVSVVAPPSTTPASLYLS